MAPEYRFLFFEDGRERLEGATDNFGHKEYARVLTQALTSAPTAFTYGLFGPWGVGKSTILREVECLIAEPPASDTAFVNFDAWRYEGDAFRREFLRTVGRTLQEQEALKPDFKLDETLRPLDVDVSVPQERVALSPGHAIRLGIVTALAAIALVLVGGTIFDSTAGAVTLLAVLPLVTYFATRVEKVVQVYQITVTEKRLDDPARFASVFHELLHGTGRGRIVIAIDNLDRCAPANAVEVLSVIKTYLEPELRGSGDGPKVVFLLAADVVALRRHLTLVAPGKDDRLAAREYADDFLRKFFNVTLLVRQLRTDDMKRYISTHLEQVMNTWSKREDRDEQLRQLVNMTSAALRDNPRRVKQFANNLELQLGLIKEREHSNKIVPPISHDVAMIGKLVLIQEYWPERFDELRVNDMLLESWHRSADQYVVPPDWEPEEWGAFSRFLRNSRRIRSKDLYPYLRLKISVSEERLQYADEFRQAVCEADFERLEYLERADSEVVAQYAAMLRSIFDRMENAKRTLEAVNVVHCAFAIPQLWKHEPAKRLLAHAIADADVAARLITIGADSLATAADGLDPGERKLLMTRLATGLGNQTLPVLQRTQIAAVLAQRSGDMGAGARREIRHAAESLDPAERLEIYTPLAKVMPEEAGAAALGLLLADPANGGDEHLAGSVVSLLAKALHSDYEPQPAQFAKALSAVSEPVLQRADRGCAEELLAFIGKHNVQLTRPKLNALEQAAAPPAEDADEAA